MKCKVCRQHAVVDVRRHNAAFCQEHFVVHIHNQVARTIKEFKMFDPDDRLLIAVSGGKDSLALWWGASFPTHRQAARASKSVM